MARQRYAETIMEARNLRSGHLIVSRSGDVHEVTACQRRSHAVMLRIGEGSYRTLPLSAPIRVLASA